MQTTKTQRTKIYGDWGQLEGIMVWNYQLQGKYWELINNYFVKNDNYRTEIV